MAVLGLKSLTLEVPNLDAGVRFYTDAGLVADVEGQVARIRCPGQSRDCLILLGGYPRKRFHHVALRAERLDRIAAAVPHHGGALATAPEGFASNGLWVSDPHGMLIHLSESDADPDLSAAEPFEINAPGRIGRVGRSAMKPRSTYAAVEPLRLGHVMLFSPDVPASVDFVSGALGMGLADRSEDIVAFCCARKQSEHHVIAFAKSPGIGFHHGSFQVHDPDEVGRGGRSLLEKSGRGDWGFGRHTVGSNFFHYIQDPWGSWFEYYSDMDYIEDHELWIPTNYRPEDSLSNWGPALPADFVHNYEADPAPFRAAARSDEVVA